MTPPPTQTNLPRPRALLFDLDGLLLNTESIYVRCIEQVLNAHLPSNPSNAPNSTTPSRSLTLPWSLLARVQGRPAPVAHGMILQWASIPSLLANPEIYFSELKLLEAKHFPEARPLPGVERLLRTMSSLSRQEKGLKIALVTSSHSDPFHWKTSHLSSTVFQYIPPQNRILGDDPRIPPGKGKPNPDIYLLALANLNAQIRAENKSKISNGVGAKMEEEIQEIQPNECLVFEDGVMGVEAGRRAGMQVVWVPDRGLRREYAGKEEVVLEGRTGEGLPVEEGFGGNGNGNGSIGESNGVNGHGHGHEPRESWGICLNSLEEFPYERYGIVVPPSPVKNGANGVV